MSDREILDKARTAAGARIEIIARPGDNGTYEIEIRDDNGVSQEPARLCQQYGHRSRPGARCEATSVPNRAGRRMLLATRSRGDEPPELADWEVDDYSRFGQRIHLRSDGGLYATTAKGHSDEQRADGSRVITASNGRILLTSKGAASVELDASDTTTTITHITGGGGAPTVLAGTAGLGAGGTATISGTDNGFSLSLTTDSMTAPGADNDAATVTFSKPFKSAPNGAACTFLGSADDSLPYIKSLGANQMIIAFHKASLPTSTTYNLSVVVVGG